MYGLEGRTAIITGAGSGFGEAIAKAFAQHGVKVALLDINAQSVIRVASEIGEAAIAFSVDVGDFEAVQVTTKQVIQQLGRIDILINNAGITHVNCPMLEVDEVTFDQVFRVNVKSIFNFAHAVIPIMQQQNSGVIINIGSVGGIRPRPGLMWYNASKGAVNLLSKSMAVELAPWNIRVNAICPTLAATGILEAAMGVADTPENRLRFLATIPMQRFVEVSDVSNAALYLVSKQAEFITGVELPVDGGRVI